MIVNLCFPKKDDHLITFCSAMVKTQTDYLLMRKTIEAYERIAKSCRVRILLLSISF